MLNSNLTDLLPLNAYNTSVTFTNGNATITHNLGLPTDSYVAYLLPHAGIIPYSVAIFLAIHSRLRVRCLMMETSHYLHIVEQ